MTKPVFRPRRTDGNQAEIVGALELAGRLVQDLHAVGQGCPDLLVSGPSGRLVLLEVKGPGGKLNGAELEWHHRWSRCLVYVVRDVETALAVTR